MAENKEGLMSLLMKGKEEREKAGLKLNIQKMKIVASGPITLWQIDGETMETVTDFIFLSPNITADGEINREIKRLFLAPWKKIYDQSRQLQYIYTMEYYSAIKNNTFESVLMKWMKRACYAEWSKPERETPIQYTNTYIWNLERW